jgi:hypothetical protein
MTTELCPCKRCGRIPIIKKVSDLFYVCCPQERYKNKYDKDVKCDKWQQYEFLGLTEAAAIRNWYWANTKKTLDEEE